MKKLWLAAVLPLFFCSFGMAYDPLPTPDYAVIAPAVSTVPLCPPLSRMKMADHFGYRIDPIDGQVSFHRGIDLAAEEGSSVSAVMGGVVVQAGFGKSYGNYLLIDHHNGFRSLYAHCSKLLC